MSSSRYILAALLIIGITGAATAHTGESFNQTQDLIEEGPPCSELSDDQLAAIGDYYMEQMHPGEMHDTMDERMGGEGSESLQEAHIHMAEQHYCDTYTTSMDRQGWMPMMGTQDHMWGGTTGWFGPLTQAGLLVLIVLGIIYLVQQITENRQAENGDDEQDDQS